MNMHIPSGGKYEREGAMAAIEMRRTKQKSVKWVSCTKAAAVISLIVVHVLQAASTNAVCREESIHLYSTFEKRLLRTRLRQ
jgi:hypothetical protein